MERTFQRVLESDEPPELLFLSGGGWKGAWGAGILTGWSASGERPGFRIVTGVSTGALMSTFAFLGPEHDATLERLYTEMEDRDILDERFFLAVPFSSSLKDTAPLRALIAEHLPDELLQAVGDEQGSRALFVGTVNLDTSEFTVWDMTKIARAGTANPACYDKYREIVRASASIPVLFPPVEIDGSLHADGGTRQNVFAKTVVPALRRSYDRFLGMRPETAKPVPAAYVIVNGKLVTEKQCVSPRIFDIASRSVDVLSTEVLIGNLYRLQAALEDNPSSDGVPWEFKLSRIPEDYCLGSGSGDFIDTPAMKKLFEKGVDWGGTRPWADAIPTDINVSPLPCRCVAGSSATKQ